MAAFKKPVVRAEPTATALVRAPRKPARRSAWAAPGPTRARALSDPSPHGDVRTQLLTRLDPAAREAFHDSSAAEQSANNVVAMDNDRWGLISIRDSRGRLG